MKNQNQIQKLKKDFKKAKNTKKTIRDYNY